MADVNYGGIGESVGGLGGILFSLLAPKSARAKVGFLTKGEREEESLAAREKYKITAEERGETRTIAKEERAQAIKTAEKTREEEEMGALFAPLFEKHGLPVPTGPEQIYQDPFAARGPGKPRVPEKALGLMGHMLTAEATAARAAAKEPRAKTNWDIAEGLAREGLAKQGVTRNPTNAEINTAAGTINYEKAKTIEQGKLDVPHAVTPQVQKEFHDRGVRINQTQGVLEPAIWDTAMKSWGAPGRFSGTLGSLMETAGQLSPELQMLYTVVDKMALKERHDMFGATLSTGENVLARAIIPNRNMHPAKLRTVLELNLMLDQWAEAFDVHMANVPRNSAEWVSRAARFRKDYPFPVSAAQGKAYGATAAEGPAIGATKKFPNGNTGVWDGKGWVKQ